MLKFTPYAWAKLVAMRDFGDTEIGGFGVSLKENPLLVADFITVKQSCDKCKVDFDDDSVSCYLDDMIDKGYEPEECMRIWIHTHPNISPQPSATDEATFRKCFGDAEWSVMFILSKNGQTYCRINFNRPWIWKEIPYCVDWTAPFAQSDFPAWKEEYKSNVVVKEWKSVYKPIVSDGKFFDRSRKFLATPSHISEKDLDELAELYRGDDYDLDNESFRSSR